MVDDKTRELLRQKLPVIRTEDRFEPCTIRLRHVFYGSSEYWDAELVNEKGELGVCYRSFDSEEDALKRLPECWLEEIEREAKVA